MLKPAPAGPDLAPSLDAGEPAFPCGPGGGAEEVGLALSGGGYRATLFHLGAIWRLNELGVLPKVDRISSVSGGSFMAAILARAWSELSWSDGVATNFEDRVAKPTLRFTSRPIDAFVIVLGLLPLVNPADLLAIVLNGTLTGGRRLAHLPERPRFIFNAANVATGVSWRFSRPYMGDSRLGIVCDPDVSVATAAAASAAFPPYVAPLVLDLRGAKLQATRGADLFDDPRYRALRRRVVLVDGGVYDNLGIESIEGRCRIALASDAGGNLRVDPRRGRFGWWWPLVRRTLDMSVEVGRAQRRRALIDGAHAAAALHNATGRGDPKRATEVAAIWRTKLEIAAHPLLPAKLKVAPGWGAYIAALPTRMWPMAEADRARTVNWGYLTADLMVREWVPELGSREPQALPFSAFGFAQSPP